MKHPALVALIIEKLDDLKAQDILVLDVKKQTSITDYMIIASGTSSQHVRSIAQYLYEETKKAGHRPMGVEGEASGEWVLLDLNDAVVHVMLPEVRAYYELEKLWQVKEIDTRIGLPKNRKTPTTAKKKPARRTSTTTSAPKRKSAVKAAAAPKKRTTTKTTAKPVRAAKAAPKRAAKPANKPASTKTTAPKRTTRAPAKTTRSKAR